MEYKDIFHSEQKGYKKELHDCKYRLFINKIISKNYRTKQKKYLHMVDNKTFFW